MLRRPLGRPKNRWKDDIRNDIKKNWKYRFGLTASRIVKIGNYMLRRPKHSKNWNCSAWGRIAEYNEFLVPALHSLGCLTLKMNPIPLPEALENIFPRAIQGNNFLFILTLPITAAYCLAQVQHFVSLKVTAVCISCFHLSLYLQILFTHNLMFFWPCIIV
jgi:hypothetical protein